MKHRSACRWLLGAVAALGLAAAPVIRADDAPKPDPKADTTPPAAADVKLPALSATLPPADSSKTAAELAAGAKTEKFHEATVAPPTGWKRAESNGMLFFVPEDLKEGQQVAMAVTPMVASEADFKADFRDFVAGVQQGMKVVKQGEPEAGTDPQGHPTLRVSAVEKDDAGKQNLRVYYLTRLKGGIAGFAYLVAGDDPQALFDRYAPTCKQFVTDLRYTEAAKDNK